MKKKSSTIMLATFVLLMIFCFAASGTAQAKSKTYRYGGCLVRKSVAAAYPSYKVTGYIYKSKLTSKKITLYGRLARYNGTSGEKGRKYITGKKTFPLAKKVKCEGVGGETYTKYTLSKTRSMLKNLNGLYFVVYVKNGKVTRMRFCS